MASRRSAESAARGGRAANWTKRAAADWRGAIRAHDREPSPCKRQASTRRTWSPSTSTPCRRAILSSHRSLSLEERVIDVMRGQPGVKAVAASDDHELAGDSRGGNVTVEGYKPPVNEDFALEESTVNSDVLPYHAGPDGSWASFSAEGRDCHPVSIVNETFVPQLFKAAALPNQLLHVP